MRLLTNVLSVGILVGFLAECSGIDKNNLIVKKNTIKQTKPYMPDEKYKSIKIPGLRKQVLSAVKSGKRKWKSVAPGYINVPMEVVLRGDVITMEVDIGGLMQSRDGGKTWDYISYQLAGGITGRDFFDFDISPTDENLIIIGGNRIYKTADRGKTWKEINKGLPPLKYNTRGNGYGQVRFNSDGSRIFAGMGTKVFWSVGWEKILAKHYKNKMLFVSNDNGDSFREIKLKTSFSPIKRIYPHPVNSNILYISFADGEFYITRNAKSKNIRFERIQMPDGYFVRAMGVSHENPSIMLLSLTSRNNTKKNPAKLMLSYNCTDANVSFKEIQPRDKYGHVIEGRDFMTVVFNPNKKGQVVIGSSHNPDILISDDNLKTFRKLEIPEKFKRDGFESNFYQQAERVYFGKSPFAVLVSMIGTWITSDNFKTIDDLTMTYDKGWFGNRGVGSPANINGLSIAKNNVYFSAQDHQAWRSDGSDFTRWYPISRKQQNIPTQTAPWGKLTWFWQIERIFASYDEKYVYINCNSWAGKGQSFRRSKKIFVSHNQGGEWQDITAALGQGEVYPGGSAFKKVLFDRNNSDRQWLSADQPARLIVIPYGKKYTENMVKMTLGDTPDEVSSNQLSFWPIHVDGEDVLAYSNINWLHSDRFFAQGPLLSTDGGKSFKWINYDLPCTNIWSADIKDGNIFIGTIFGLMQMRYK